MPFLSQWISTPKHYWLLSRHLKGTSLHETTSYEPLCIVIGLAIFDVGNDKNKKGKERKGMFKSHKIVIFHIFVDKTPSEPIVSKFYISREMGDLITCAHFGVVYKSRG